MGNCTILSCSLVPLYRKVFWLVYLLWVGIKLHLGNRPPTTIPPAISPQVSEWMSEWVSGSQVYLSNSPTTTQHCISLESTPHIRLRNDGHLCFYDSFSQGSHCTACTKHWPNIVVNLACGHSDLNSPAPHCATHCFYAKSSTGQNKIDGCLRPRPPRSQLASIPDPRPFLIHSDPESFSFARLTDLLVFMYSDVHLCPDQWFPVQKLCSQNILNNGPHNGFFSIFFGKKQPGVKSRSQSKFALTVFHTIHGEEKKKNHANAIHINNSTRTLNECIHLLYKND